MAVFHHPFAVKAYFRHSVVLAFACPAEELQALLPCGLDVDQFGEKGFVACAFVDTKNLRPAALPHCMGQDFVLAGYRIFVRFTNEKGKRKRGLFILRSETNRKHMQWMGGIFTGYRYSTTTLTMTESIENIIIKDPSTGLHVVVSDMEPALPSTSPFGNWSEARKFAGPLPFTFDKARRPGYMHIVEGKRQNWEPRPLNVKEMTIPFINNLPVSSCQLANAFLVERVDYQWKKGYTEKCSKSGVLSRE